MRQLVAIGLLSLSATFFAFGCGSPTLEEACENYCEWYKSTDCGEQLPGECSVGCGQLEKALNDAGQGDCIDAYTAALDCVPGSDYACFNGFPVPTDTGCAEEALDLAECVQGGVDDD